MKEAVTKVIDTQIQEDFHGAFQKLLERTTSALQPGEITSKETRVSCVLSIKVPIRKKSGNLFNDPRNSTWDWTLVSRFIGEHSIYYAYGSVKRRMLNL